MIWTSKQIGKALSLTLATDNEFGKVQFNSKDIEKGDIFIALKGGARDGHEFVLDAFARVHSLRCRQPRSDQARCSRAYKFGRSDVLLYQHGSASQRQSLHRRQYQHRQPWQYPGLPGRHCFQWRERSILYRQRVPWYF